MEAKDILEALNQAQNDTSLEPIAVWALSRYLQVIWKDDTTRVIRPYNLGKAMSDFFVDLSQHRLPEKITAQTPETESFLMKFFGASSGSLSEFWTQSLQIWDVALSSSPDFASEVKNYFDMLLKSSLRKNLFEVMLDPSASSEPATAEAGQQAADLEPAASGSSDDRSVVPSGQVPLGGSEADPGAGIGAVLAARLENPSAETSASIPSPEPDPQKLPKNAYLILQGTRVIPLNQTFIKIGRQLDNHILLEDPRVSRSHAQIKVVNDRFVIYDMHSTGGTYVNGKRIDQAVLYPGDVISLAGVVFIYSHELPAKPGSVNVIELGSRFAADRPTAVMRREDVSTLTRNVSNKLPDLPKTGPLQE